MGQKLCSKEYTYNRRGLCCTSTTDVSQHHRSSINRLVFSFILPCEFDFEKKKFLCGIQLIAEFAVIKWNSYTEPILNIVSYPYTSSSHFGTFVIGHCGPNLRSVGVVTYVLLTGFMPFSGNTDMETLHAILHADLDLSPAMFEGVSEDALCFMRKLFQRNPRWESTWCILISLVLFNNI